VDFCTQNKIVLIFDAHDYSGGSNYVYNYQDGSLQAAIAWFQSLATAYKDNPYVWFQTENEPGTPNEDEMNGLYDAVRNAGNETVVALSWVTWGYTDRTVHSIANRMHNVIIDLHYYAMSTGSDNHDIEAHKNTIANNNHMINAAYKSQDGEIPICCLEFGDACCGQVEPAGQVAIQAVCESVFRGWTLWNWTTDWNHSWGHDIINDKTVAVLGGTVAQPYMLGV
jgi:hypothetical protein